MAARMIDVHHHILPPLVVESLEKNPALTHGLKLPEWSATLSLEFMERHDIGAAVLSLPIPVSLLTQDRDKGVLLTRQINEEMKRHCDDHPTKFGFFAALPSLRDAKACVDEIRYAFKTLGAAGVTLFTSYDERYLGHPDFQPVWNELTTQAAVVFVHPTIEGAEKAITEPFALPRPIFDWPHETTRTAMHLIATETLRRSPGCRVILSHGGGTLPFVAGRAADLIVQMQLSDKPAGEFVDDMGAFFFDIALAGYQGPLQLLLDFARPGHVMFGSDFPFARDATVTQQLAHIANVLGERGIAAQVGWQVAETLLPRLGRK